MTAFKNFQKIIGTKCILNKLGFFCTILGIFLFISFVPISKVTAQQYTIVNNGSTTINNVYRNTSKPFNFSFTAAGAPNGYKISGGVPGLNFAVVGAAATLVGIPTSVGTAPINITVSIQATYAPVLERVGLTFRYVTPPPVTASFTFVITDLPPEVPNYTITGVVNEAITGYFVNPSPTTPTVQYYTLESGILPPGISFDATKGMITGTPSAPGTYTVRISATNDGGKGDPSLYGIISFNIVSPVPVITSAITETIQEGTQFTYTIAATNTPTSFSTSILPDGLKFNGATISGIPDIPGTYNTLITAANSSGTATANLTLIILPPVPVISSAATVTGSVGTSFTYNIIASNNPTIYGASPALPAGLSLNTTTGIISGIPLATAVGTNTYSIIAKNAGGSSTALSLTITITPPVPIIVGSRFVNGVVLQSFSYLPTLSPSTPSTSTAWAISEGALPPGLVLTTSTGLISGTPTATGFYSFTLSATNVGSGVTGYKEISVYIPIANGTANTVAKFTSNTSLGNSDIVDNGVFVGVFTTVQSASNYVFEVNGDAIFTRIVVKNYTTWPDYVFDNDYKLTPLAEVEKYINEHKHLSGLPSASDIKKDGIDVAVNQGVLLQKIEELTLYIIEQNKKSAEQDKKIDQLQNQNDQLQELKKEVEGLKELLQKK